MKGHIRQRSPGKWAIVLDVESANGKRKQRWFSFAGTKRQAQLECARLIGELQSGGTLTPTKTTVAGYLNAWLEHIKASVSPRTHERYTEIVRKNIIPLIGGALLTKLQPVAISRAYAKALERGRCDGKGALSANTVLYMHRILRSSLKQAVRWQLINRDPTDAVRPPRIERPKREIYDLAQTAELLEGMRGTSMFIPTVLAVLCGLRRGEIAALRWCHLSLDAGRLSVLETVEQTGAGVRYKEPKGRRTRAVALSQTVVKELRAHRLRQAQELLQLGVRQTEDCFVVAQYDGRPMQPRSLTHAWVRLLGRTGLPRLRLHDLRHAHATHMLASGVHPKIAQERLGHSTVAITLDLYSHVLPGMQEDAVARVDDGLQDAIERYHMEAPKKIR
jgi:integrase